MRTRLGSTLSIALMITALVALGGCTKSGADGSSDKKDKSGAAAKKAPPPQKDTKADQKPEKKPAEQAEKKKPAPSGDQSAGLMDPGQATEQAPEKFRAKFETSKGDFVIEVTRKWSPNGADRFYNLIKVGFYDNVKFFRTVKGFMVQFGIHGDPEVSEQWRNARIPDDMVVKSNQRGMISYAKPGAPDSRTTQVFINYANNSNLDGMGFSPFGEVVEGMDVIDSLEGKYRESPSKRQGDIQMKGNAFLEDNFPDLDYIKRAVLIDG